MKNTVVCKNCGAENPFYQHICKSCQAYLRERVVNLDLWKLIGLLIESPTRGFTQIIHSEHKNFLTLVVCFASLKLLIDSVFIGVLLNSYNPLRNFFLNYLILTGIFLFIVYFTSFTLNKIKIKSGLETRTRDNFSILIYSFIPHIIGLIFLFPVELILFGQYLFSSEPSPFQLKEALAYTLLVFEFLIISWGLFLNFMAVYTQSGSKSYSFIVTIFFNLILYFTLYLFAQIFIR